MVNNITLSEQRNLSDITIPRSSLVKSLYLPMFSAWFRHSTNRWFEETESGDKTSSQEFGSSELLTCLQPTSSSVWVYRSNIHGRGLYAARTIEPGETIIEYTGELVRSSVADLRERKYDKQVIHTCHSYKTMAAWLPSSELWMKFSLDTYII